MAYGYHKYRISIIGDIEHVREYLYRNELIEGVTGDSSYDTKTATLDITVIVTNKKNFEEWFSPKKRFREANDPILLGYIVGKPVKLPDNKNSPTDKKHRNATKEEKTKKLEKLRNKFDFRRK